MWILTMNNIAASKTEWFKLKPWHLNQLCINLYKQLHHSLLTLFYLRTSTHKYWIQKLLLFKNNTIHLYKQVHAYQCSHRKWAFDSCDVFVTQYEKMGKMKAPIHLSISTGYSIFPWKKKRSAGAETWFNALQWPVKQELVQLNSLSSVASRFGISEFISVHV